MPLHLAIEPNNGSALVLAGLNRLSVRTSAALPLALRRVDFNTLHVTPPHAIYDLRADEIVSGGGLATARATGFRYLVEASGAAVAAAEVHTDAFGDATLLVNINYGPFVEATSRAFAQLATLDQVRTGSYEARLLRFSAIPVMAIWLKDDRGGADIILPLAPGPDVLKAETPYGVDEFLKAVLPIARKRAARPSSPAVP